ncbi:MAG: hypothetical protein WAM14_23925 [Candidatus Nitrosopolaris sp.]
MLTGANRAINTLLRKNYYVRVIGGIANYFNGCNTLVYVIHLDNTALVIYSLVNERVMVAECDHSILAM